MSAGLWAPECRHSRWSYGRAAPGERSRAPQVGQRCWAPLPPTPRCAGPQELSRPALSQVGYLWNAQGGSKAPAALLAD